MQTERSTLVTAARILADTLEQDYGVDPSIVFDAAAIRLDELRGNDARVPETRGRVALQEALRITGDPCLGLKAGQRYTPQDFHAIGFAWMAAHNLLDSVRRLQRYYQVFTTAPLRIEIEELDLEYRMTTEFQESDIPPPPSVATDIFLMAIVNICRLAAGHEFKPTGVWLTHDGHDRQADFEAAFGCPVQFSADISGMSFDKAVMDEPLRGDNPELLKAIDKVAEDYLRSLKTGGVSDQVREILLTMLPQGAAQKEMVAKRLNRSASTLQRQLEAEGTSFRALLDDTRQTLAIRYLADRQYSLGDIAYLLGFSHPGNFSKAFKRWTGRNPRTYRK